MIASPAHCMMLMTAQALVKFNESLAMNKNLRERIDTLRRERVVFDSIYKKLERELHEKKKVRVRVGVGVGADTCEVPSLDQGP